MATMDSLSLPLPDVIKIDAEDHEIEVLKGAAATIDRARPFVVFENWLHKDRPALTLDPFHWFEERGYSFFHAAWVAGTAEYPDYIVSALPKGTSDKATLAVMPFLAAQRFHLPSQLNVIAVPNERVAELRRRITGQGA